MNAKLELITSGSSLEHHTSSNKLKAYSHHWSLSQALVVVAPKQKDLLASADRRAVADATTGHWHHDVADHHC